MDLPALPPTPPAGARPAPATIRQVAQSFEAMMVGQMLESMFAGVGTGGVFGGGAAESTWRSFMLREYGEAIARSGTLGVGRVVHDQVARLYDAQATETVR